MWEMGYRTGGSKDFSTVRKSVNFHGTRERVFANLSASIVLADGGGECAGEIGRRHVIIRRLSE